MLPPSRAPQHNRHGKPRKTAIPGTSEWGLSQPNHLRKRPTTYGSCQPQMGTFTASHHRTANQSTTNVDFHSRLGWLAADGLNYCRVSDNFRDKNDNFCHIRHGSCHQPAVVVTNPAENESRGQNETKARPNNPMIRQDQPVLGRLSHPVQTIQTVQTVQTVQTIQTIQTIQTVQTIQNRPDNPDSPNSSKQSKQSTQSRQFRQATSTPWTLHSPSVCCDAWDYDAWDPDA